MWYMLLLWLCRFVLFDNDHDAVFLVCRHKMSRRKMVVARGRWQVGYLEGEGNGGCLGNCVAFHVRGGGYIVGEGVAFHEGGEEVRGLSRW